MTAYNDNKKCERETERGRETETERERETERQS